MFGKNRNKKVGICVMVVTASLVLAGLWAVLATPETALAAPKKPKPPKGGGDGACCSLNFCITFRENDAIGGDELDEDNDGETDPYCNGGKIVAIAGGSAKQGCGFRFDMNKGQQFGQGRLGFLDLSACLDDGDVVDVGLNLSDFVELQFRFEKRNEADDTVDDGDPVGAGGLDFCSMDVGESGTVPMWISVVDASGNSVAFLIVFGAPFPPTGREGEVGSNSEPVTVTRLDDLEDGRRVWTIESFDTPKGAAVRNTDNEEVLCSIPFQMTLTEQP
jgi:hypothetical protein